MSSLRRRAVIASALIGCSVTLLLGELFAQTVPTTLPASMPASMPALAPLPRVPAAPAFEATTIADHLTAPWAIAFLPDGRALVTERAGRVRIISKDMKLIDEPALVVTDVRAWLKMGVLGITIDPDFAANNFVYTAINYGDDKQDHTGEKWMRIVRYTFRDDHLVDPLTLVDRIPAFWNHTGGRLKFGPDGKLYITTGDADNPPNAQDKSSLSGKILRINNDGSIPSDNPFGTAIWTYGHRNPQGLAWRPKDNQLYAPEHGPNGGDEINRIVVGSNYGWPIIDHDRTHEGMISPLAEFTPSVAPAAALFYTGDLFPTLKGDLLVGCLRGEGILRVRLDDSGEHIVSVERLLYHKIGRLREVVQAPDGALWITTSEIDPPDGKATADKNPNGFDKVIRLTLGKGAGDASAVPDETTMPRPVGAVAIYAYNCASCHGNGGQSLNSSLFDRKWLQIGGSDDDIRRVIHDGIQNRGMPTYKDLLTPDEVNELVAFIRNREDTNRH